MRKITLNLLSLLCMLFTFQSVLAQEVIFEEKFARTVGDFTEENADGSTEFWGSFMFSPAIMAEASGTAMDSRLISPDIQLKSYNNVAFQYRAGDFTDLENQVFLSVKKIGGEWKDIKLPVLNNQNEWVSVEIAVPAEFDNANVKIALHYVASAGKLCVKEFVVKGSAGAPAEKKDPALTFGVTEAEYTLGATEFKAPVLENPFNVKVDYSSSNAGVAIVSSEGVVKVVAEGTTTIKAVSKETSEYFAGEASYILTVKKEQSGGETENGILIEESFGGADFGDFTEENADGSSYTWQLFSIYSCAMAEAGGLPRDARLVSPVFMSKTENTVKFEYYATDFTNIPEQFMLSVREVNEEKGAWDEIKIPNLYINGWADAEIKLPAKYDNKKIQIAVRYFASSGMLLLKNLKVTAKGGAAPVEKKDPQLSFSAAEMTYTMGEEFVAPILANPNNLAITYSSSDENVATVNAKGGVAVFGEGTVTIKAVSAETDEFKAGEASYVLTVKKGEGGDKPTSEVIFEEKFDNTKGEFTEENADGSNGFWQLFFITKTPMAMADGVAKDSRFVSPEIQLKANNTVSFTYRAGDFSNPENQIFVSVKKVGGEWQDIKLPKVINDNTWNPTEVVIPAEFNNEKVHLAIHFVASNGMLMIKDFVVKAGNAPAPVEKKDPKLSYSLAEMIYTMGEEFVAPTLSNEFNLAVTYSSSDEKVATVDAEGVVKVLAEGKTTIKAVSAETDEYKAGEASFVLTVKKEQGFDPETGIVFEESFAESLGDFTEESAKEGVWKWHQFSQAAVADAANVGEGAQDSRLVSPVIKLVASNSLEVSYWLDEFSDPAKAFSVAIKEVGGEWKELKLNKLVQATEFVNDTIAIGNEFANKKVQFSIRYNADGGRVRVKNFVVRGSNDAPAPVEKKDPQISFEKETIEFTFEEGKDIAFESQKLTNPNNVTVKYTSSDEKVATVDALTGDVKILAAGTVKITATSEENDEFKSAAASYTIKVTMTSGIEGITADDLSNGKVYDLQGRRVNKLGKGLYIVNGKKIVIK